MGRLVIDYQVGARRACRRSGRRAPQERRQTGRPKKTQEITILGEVQSPTSHVFEAGLTRDDYIAKSGGTTQKADRKRIYVVRANGDVVSETAGRVVQADP